tara:strand:- start:3794 stop:4849 length:1056 start_codon:yes stop_codon:yes gene_type:complete
MYIGNDLRSGRAEVFHYTSTSGGETVVTTASDGRSIRYDVGYCNVYLNGVRLHDSDYAATTGTSITNLVALSQNDVLIVEAPSTFSTTNTVPASGGSFTGPLTIDGGINQKAAAQDLSGTYANERMYINDLYSLKGDVNITGHLALGSISSGDIVISDDGNNREISGTGTLETGGILQERNTLLTGMTGELGSTVTGSPNLNLGNATGTIGSAVTGQNRPYFFCSEYSANTSIASTEVELTVWTEGTNGDPDSKFNNSTGRFTPGVAGIYLFGARIFFEGAASSFARCIIRVNNGSNNDVYAEKQGTGQTMQLTRMEYLSETGYASVLAKSHTNSNALRGSQCHFWGIRIA